MRIKSGFRVLNVCKIGGLWFRGLPGWLCNWEMGLGFNVLNV